MVTSHQDSKFFTPLFVSARTRSETRASHGETGVLALGRVGVKMARSGYALHAHVTRAEAA